MLRIGSLVLFMLVCAAAIGGTPEHAATKTLLVTVLCTNDPVRVADLLHPVGGKGSVARTYRSSPEPGEDAVWQVNMLEGSTARIATDEQTTQLLFPLVHQRQRKTEVWTVLDEQTILSGFSISAKRAGADYLLEIDWFSGVGTATDKAQLATLLRATPGVWQDAGGTLIANPGQSGVRHYSAGSAVPGAHRWLIRVDELN